MSVLDALLRDNHDFRPWGFSHLIVNLIFVVSIVFISTLASRLSDESKSKLVFGFCVTLQLTIATWSAIRFFTGTFVPTVVMNQTN
jgi:hypothetical protein